MEIIKETEPKARKNHNCHGNEQIHDFIDMNDPAQQEAIDQAKNCNGIKKGDVYINQLIKDGADIWNFKSCQECSYIIAKFKFYDY